MVTKTWTRKIDKDLSRPFILIDGFKIDMYTQLKDAYEEYKTQIAELWDKMDPEADIDNWVFYNNQHEADLKKFFLGNLEITVTLKHKKSKRSVKSWIIKKIKQTFKDEKEEIKSRHTRTCHTCDTTYESPYEFSSMCESCILKHANTIM